MLLSTRGWTGRKLGKSHGRLRISLRGRRSPVGSVLIILSLEIAGFSTCFDLLSRECFNNAEESSVLETADTTRKTIREEIQGKVKDNEEILEEIPSEDVKVPVVRLRMGRMAEAR